MEIVAEGKPRPRGEHVPEEIWEKIRPIYEARGSMTKAAREYGVSKAAIYYQIRAKKWKKKSLGGKRGIDAAAKERLVEKLAEKGVTKYESQIAEVCEGHLVLFKNLQKVSHMALQEVHENLKYKMEYNVIARARNREAMAAGFKTLPMTVLSVTAEVYQLGSLGNTVTQAVTQGERVILGITDFKHLKDTATDNPISKMMDVVSAGIVELTEGVKNGTIDINTGDIIDIGPSDYMGAESPLAIPEKTGDGYGV